VQGLAWPESVTIPRLDIGDSQMHVRRHKTTLGPTVREIVLWGGRLTELAWW
jgi:hypothetical protein